MKKTHAKLLHNLRKVTSSVREWPLPLYRFFLRNVSLLKAIIVDSSYFERKDLMRKLYRETLRHQSTF